MLRCGRSLAIFNTLLMLRRGSSLTLAIFNTLLMLRCGRSLAILHALLMLRCGSSLAFFVYTLLMLRCGPSLAIFNMLLMPRCGRSQLQKNAPSKPWRCNMQNHKNHLKNHRKTMKNQHDVTWLQLKRVVTMNWNQLAPIVQEELWHLPRPGLVGLCIASRGQLWGLERF